MGMCKPSGGIKKIFGPYREDIEPLKDTPNTRTDYFDEITGKLLQQRWYGPDGRAIWDRDWDHNDFYHRHTFPHDHYWIWKNPIHPGRKEYLGFNGELINNMYC